MANRMDRNCLFCCSRTRQSVCQVGGSGVQIESCGVYLLPMRRCDVIFIHPVPAKLLSLIYPPNYYSYTLLTESWVFKVKSLLDRFQYRQILSLLPQKELALLDVGEVLVMNFPSQEGDSRIHRTVMLILMVKSGDAPILWDMSMCVQRLNSTMQRKVLMRFSCPILSSTSKKPEAFLPMPLNEPRPGGITVLRTPSTEGLDAKLFRSGNWGGYHCPRHWVLFTEKTLAAAARKVGYEILQLRTRRRIFLGFECPFLPEDMGGVCITAERPAMFHPLFSVLAAALP